MTDDIMDTSAPAPESVMTPEALELKKTLTDIITWSERNRPRSVQVELGPSDLGSACDRRIGYKIAAVPEVNRFNDPWTVFVGSAIHTRLQEAVDSWDHTHAAKRFLTEQSAPLDEFVKSHPDLLDKDRRMVIDHKSTNTDFLKQLNKGADPHEAVPGYIIQVQLYGLAFERLGFAVEKVALAFYPRAGRLRDMFCWVGDYDRDVAQVAWDRPYEIAQLLGDLDVVGDSRRWSEVPSAPSNACGLCPWYDPGRQGMAHADDTGCPGW